MAVTSDRKLEQVEMARHQSTASDHVEIQKIHNSLHHDEGLGVLAAEHGSDDWEPSEEKAVLRKIDRKLLWIMCLVFPLQIYDKNMLGQAAIFGIRDDLHLTQSQYTIVSGFLYIGYFVGSYPSSVLAQLFPAERVAGTIILLWATCLILTVACQNFGGLLAQRIILGVLEGGVSPIFVLVTTSWYTKSEQAFRIGIWWCTGGYAGFISPLINYGIGQITGGSLHSWQYMYLVAGGLTVMLAIITYVFLPGDPIRAKGFSPREGYIAVARLRINNSGVRNVHWKKEQVIEALLDVRFWLMFLISLTAMVGNGALSTMSPIVIHGLGFDPLHTLLLASPTGIIMGTTQLLTSYLASKTTNSVAS